MRDELLKLLDKAYAPYSKFCVSAIIEMNDGRLVRGVNVENASYGATICAERNAIVNAITLGYKKGDFKRMYVMTSGKRISSCCFLCRQVIQEFFSSDAVIVLMDKKGNSMELKVSDLCPYPFDEEDL